MSRPSLRVADADDAPRAPHAKIADALDGTGRDVLASMRLALAKKLDAGEVSSNAIASAYKELRELDRQIRAMDAADEQEATRRADVSRSRRSFETSAL
jgi:hypothetical protein